LKKKTSTHCFYHKKRQDLPGTTGLANTRNLSGKCIWYWDSPVNSWSLNFPGNPRNSW